MVRNINEENAKIYDEERTSYFNGLGIIVLRFTNLDIINHFSEVCLVIDEKVKVQIDPHQSRSARQLPLGEAFETGDIF